MTVKLDGSCPKCGYRDRVLVKGGTYDVRKSQQSIERTFFCNSCCVRYRESYSLVKSEVIEE